jgi:HlyD family secretion protein
MHKVKGFWNTILNWSIKKKIIYGVILLAVIFLIYMIFGPKDNSANITTDTVKMGDLKETILATGQVTSTTDLNLSFSGSGIVRGLKTKVGDKVKSGQILATLEQGNVLGALTSARGAVAAAEARYKKILDGASSEEITLSKVALENAKLELERVKLQQEILVNNAYRNLLNSTPEALPENGTTDYSAPVITGNYTKGIEGTIKLSVYQSSGGANFSISGIITGTGSVAGATAQPIGDSGLFIAFSSSSLSIRDWTISIPNKQASNYSTNLNAYELALKTRDSAIGGAQALVDQRTAELSLKQSSARQADLELAQADILSAQGQLQNAQANYEHTVLRAPAEGTITKVDIKLGEIAQSGKEVMVLQDVSNLYLEANVNEANIGDVAINAPVELSFDAFGTDNLFSGQIMKIDPASTLVSGVVNYKVTASIISSPTLRPGMTANMTILVGEKKNVLMVPARSILTDKTGRKTVRLINNSKKKTYTEVEVATGMEGDGGLTEITAGLKEGDEIVLLIKK